MIIILDISMLYFMESQSNTSSVVTETFVLQSLDNSPAVEVSVRRWELAEMPDDGVHRLEGLGSRQVVLVTIRVPRVVHLLLQLLPEHIHRHAKVLSCDICPIIGYSNL